MITVLEEESLMPVRPSGSAGLARRIVLNMGGLVSSRVLRRPLVYQRQVGGGLADWLPHDARSHNLGRAFDDAGCDDALRARGNDRLALRNDPAGSPCCSRFSLSDNSACAGVARRTTRGVTTLPARGVTVLPARGDAALALRGVTLAFGARFV